MQFEHPLLLEIGDRPPKLAGVCLCFLQARPAAHLLLPKSVAVDFADALGAEANSVLGPQCPVEFAQRRPQIKPR